MVPALLPRLTLNFNISLLKDPIRSNADRVFFVCYLDMQNHSLYINQRLSCVKGTFGLSKNASPVFGVRVSGGHLCEAEAPTEAAAETVDCEAMTEGLLQF